MLLHESPVSCYRHDLSASLPVGSHTLRKTKVEARLVLLPVRHMKELVHSSAAGLSILLTVLPGPCTPSFLCILESGGIMI